MESSLSLKNRNRQRRASRNRHYLRGTEAKPRLCVVKTNAHIHIQLIDDEKGVTLASTSTVSPEFRGKEFGRKNKKSGFELGKKIAALALQCNVKTAIFDRGPFKYHGVIAAVADGAREGGLGV